MAASRDRMVAALKETVVPELRGRGFRGPWPHFRRPGEQKIDLLSFQFDRHGGGFVIEIAQCSLDGFETHWGEKIPAGKVKALDMPPKERLRLQPGPGGSTGDWFRYGEGGERECEAVAQALLPYLESAERWWRGENDAVLERAVKLRTQARG